MFNLDPGKLIVIAVVAIILLGPDRLPQVARQVGGAWRSFNEFRHRMETEVRSSMPDLPPTSEIARLARSPSAPPQPPLEHVLGRRRPGRGARRHASSRRCCPTAVAGNGQAPPRRRDRRRRATPAATAGADPPRPRWTARTPAAAVRGRRPQRPDAQLNGRAVVTLPFTAKRKSRPSPDNMTLGEHLGELRRRVIICVIAFVVAATIAVFAYEPILHFLLRPLCSVDASTVHHTSTGRLAHHHVQRHLQPLRHVAARRALPPREDRPLRRPRPGVAVILFQVWRFVTPGLKASERRYAIPFVLSAFVLFLLGAATAYITLPHALGWLKSVGGPNLQAIYDPIPYLGLILLMMTIFGLTFEFPVVLVSLELARVVTPARLLRSWRWAVIIIVVVAAVFTPSSDPFSMFALAIPLVAFYFISIGIGKLLGR